MLPLAGYADGAFRRRFLGQKRQRLYVSRSQETTITAELKPDGATKLTVETEDKNGHMHTVIIDDNQIVVLDMNRREIEQMAAAYAAHTA
jgi:hypothetical protein